MEAFSAVFSRGAVYFDTVQGGSILTVPSVDEKSVTILLLNETYF